ncbi:MAG TPA: class I SAM-dependent methyltransferase, partial [Patescibacteria group bacterium]
MNQTTAEKLVKKVKDDYVRIADEFSESRSSLWPEMTDFLTYIKDGDQILDLGCGNGRLCQLFRDKKISYLGIDNSPELIADASQKFTNYQSKCQFEVGDILNISQQSTVNSQQYNVIFMIAVLQHIPSKKLQLKVLRDVNKLLKKDGYLIMTNWNLYRRKYWSYLFRKYFSFKSLKLTGWDIKDALIPWKGKNETV